jgi:two-component system response regulator HydG
MMDEPTVLVVDDNKDLLDTFSLILKRRGFYVETAENGAGAVAKYREHPFDVILMDIVMPEMNGVEAFRKIRDMHPGATVKLMTAYSEETLVQTAIDEGARQVVHKPIRIDRLIELIKEAAASEPILIVDDDADICHTLTRVLESEGYEVMTAGSGEEAVLMAEDKACQVAFIDIKLPNIDGLETFLRLKEINPGILTIMMTGFRNEVKDALDKAQAAKAITCLYKPFDPSEAAEILNKISKKPRRSRS